MKRICVFAGASDGGHPAYREAARELGGELARRGISLVYGAGGVGMMGALAAATHAAGGEVIGVMPRFLVERELAAGVPGELRLVDSMHERKALMAELSDAFLALPGGLGTLEELLEAATWTQLGLHEKPVGLLNVRGYYHPLLAMLSHACEEGFLSAEQSTIITHDESPSKLLDRISAWQAPPQNWRTRAPPAR